MGGASSNPWCLKNCGCSWEYPLAHRALNLLVHARLADSAALAACGASNIDHPFDIAATVAALPRPLDNHATALRTFGLRALEILTLRQIAWESKYPEEQTGQQPARWPHTAFEPRHLARLDANLRGVDEDPEACEEHEGRYFQGEPGHEVY
jgi:hypothetical protein